MSPTQDQSSQDKGGGSKQRVSKACNRCRLKKAKCSGGYPCSKCKSSDAICTFVFGDPRTSKRKHFPENYVRMMETQHFKLVAGIQTMYFLLLSANSWPGPKLPEHNGNPLIHDILTTLGLLEPDQDTNFDFHDHRSEDLQHQSVTDEASAAGSPDTFQTSEVPSSGELPMSREVPSQREIQPSREIQRPREIRPSMEMQSSMDASESKEDQTDYSSTSPQHSEFAQTSSETLDPKPDGYWNLQPLPTDFQLKPPPKMAGMLQSTSPPFSNIEAMSWDTIDHLVPWGYDGTQSLQQTSCPDAAGLQSVALGNELDMDTGNFLGPTAFLSGTDLAGIGGSAPDCNLLY